MTSTRRIALILTSSLAISTLLLTGCAASAPEPAETSAPEVTPAAETTEPEVATVPGFDVGAFPPIPLFQLPDLSLLDSSASAFTIEVDEVIDDIPGVTVTPAHCNADGTVLNGHGTSYLYGDGGGNYTGPDGTIQNYGDGAGNAVINGVTIQNNGDGSGNYSDGTVSIQNGGDGSGSYVGPDKTVQISGDGAGSYSDGAITVQNNGDGTGTYADGTMSIQNNGDGSGNYVDGILTIQNNGDGTGVVNGTTVDVDPLPPVPLLGVFPPLTALAPIESCGTIITFNDAVLFEFNKSDIRPDADTALAGVAEALTSVDAPQVIVSGHTDAIGSDSENQTLSEARADAVVGALEGEGVLSDLVAEGYGETRPVAANEIDGVDNPAGRQLNRRVEIFIPAS